MDAIKEISKPVSEKYIQEIIKLHYEAFSNQLIGQLGDSFTLYLYNKIVDSEHGVLLIYETESNVVGYLAGLSGEERIYDINFYLHASKALMVSVIKKPTVIANLIRYVYKQLTTNRKLPKSELFSIVVNINYQKRGIGTELVKEYEEWLKSRKINNYKVYTDTKYSTGSQLYQKMGFELRDTVNLLNNEYMIYVKKIGNDGK
jgi:GNAT superfamily N-acetyltransferase